MATEKEIAAVNLLVAAALKVNASSERVNVSLEIDSACVRVNVVDPALVSSDGNWDWLYYGGRSAYFSGDVFTESAFVASCDDLLSVINSFEGRTVSESA